MLRRNENGNIRILFLSFLLVATTCFYSFYAVSNANHHCDDPEDCPTCICIHALSGDNNVPIGSSLNSNLFNFCSVFSSEKTAIISLFLAKETLVSNRVKKTE